MLTFIILHKQGKHGDPVYLNVDTVTTFSEDFEDTGADRQSKGSSIGRIGQQFVLLVRETPEEIIQLIAQAKEENA